MVVVDVQFRILGKQIPVDHGFQLFAAISRVAPELHDCGDVGVHPISGALAADRTQCVTDRSLLRIRLPADKIPAVLPLAGKTLQLETHSIVVGVPSTSPLIPSSRLYSRLVTIKGFMEPEPFLAAVQRQVEALGIEGKPYLIPQPHIESTNRGKESGSHSPFLRRTLRIHGKEVVGFAVGIEQLTAEESILVQERGIGGRRRFGCGIFVPDRR